MAIRKSGGFVAFYWQGNLPDPRDTAFAAALADHRFRTIEHAASEEEAVGWVTPADPTGDTFDAEDLDAGAATWLRLRIDRKQLPKKWLAIHRDAAEKSRGRRLSARERRELKDDLAEKLLPRILPNVTLVDALLFPERRTVLLCATSKSARENFAKLFFHTFALPLDRADPFQLALHAGLPESLAATLDRLQAVRWPEDGAGRRRTAPDEPSPRDGVSLRATTAAMSEDEA
jgi:hypothetical protein